MVKWNKSTDFILASEIDSILGKIKRNSVSNNDVKRVIETIMRFGKIDAETIEYINVSFSGTLQQKLLVTISKKDIDFNDLANPVNKFRKHFKDITSKDIDMVAITKGNINSYVFISCITDEVKDVFEIM